MEKYTNRNVGRIYHDNTLIFWITVFSRDKEK